MRLKLTSIAKKKSFVAVAETNVKDIDHQAGEAKDAWLDEPMHAEEAVVGAVKRVLILESSGENIFCIFLEE